MIHFLGFHFTVFFFVYIKFKTKKKVKKAGEDLWAGAFMCVCVNVCVIVCVSLIFYEKKKGFFINFFFFLNRKFVFFCLVPNREKNPPFFDTNGLYWWIFINNIYILWWCSRGMTFSKEETQIDILMTFFFFSNFSQTFCYTTFFSFF
jgi:hypothetical protein